MTHETVTEEYDIQAIICVVIKQKVLISVALKLSLHFTLHSSRVSCSVDYINQNLRSTDTVLWVPLYSILSFHSSIILLFLYSFIPLSCHFYILSFLYPFILKSFHDSIRSFLCLLNPFIPLSLHSSILSLFYLVIPLSFHP